MLVNTVKEAMDCISMVQSMKKTFKTLENIGDDNMKVSYVTPETVDNKFTKVENVEEYISSMKEEHPNLRLCKYDMWSLRWNKEGYQCNDYILLSLSFEELDKVRKVLNPNLKMFQVTSQKVKVEGYIDTSKKTIKFVSDDGFLENVFDFHSENEDKNSLMEVCKNYRTNLRYLLFQKKRTNISFGELFGWGIKDSPVDLFGKLKEYFLIITDDEKYISGDDAHFSAFTDEHIFNKNDYILLKVNGCVLKAANIQKIREDITISYNNVDVEIKSYDLKQLIVMER